MHRQTTEGAPHGHSTTVAAATGDTQPRIPFTEIEADFNTHYGYRALPLGEDGEQVIILGHLEPLHAAGIARAVVRDDTDGTVSKVTEVRNTHVEFTRHFDGCDKGEFCNCLDMSGWWTRYSDQPTGHSTAMTVVDVECW